MAFAREEIDPEAVKILNQAGFTWDPQLLAFRRKEREAEAGDAATIDYEFLREQKLVAGSSLDQDERVGQLLRLRILLQSLN